MFLLLNFFILILSLLAILKGANLVSKYANRLSTSLKLSRFTIGFVFISIILMSPEIIISLTSSSQAIPTLGLGMLLGSAIADLTLAFAILVFISKKSLSIQSQTLKSYEGYIYLLFLPFLLGLDGAFSSIDGVILILAGIFAYFKVLEKDIEEKKDEPTPSKNNLKHFFFLILGVSLLLIGAHLIIFVTKNLASLYNFDILLVGLLFISLGALIPELTLAVDFIKKGYSSLAIGNLLGAALGNTTLVLGILALSNPFTFPARAIYLSGSFLIFAALILYQFMLSERSLNRKEARILLVFWLLFISSEMYFNF